MKSKSTALLGLVSLVCLYAFAATATGAGNDRVLISDPNTLASMGFPPTATDVYQLANTTNTNRAVSDADAAADFGPATSFTGIAAKSFIGRQNTAATPWQYDGGEVGCCTNLSRTGSEAFADAPLNLPNGVGLQFIRFWANDTNAASDLDFFVLEACYPTFGAGATSTTSILQTLGTTGATGNQSNAAGPVAAVTINNRDCVYTVRANFQATTGLTLQKLRAQWVRQISPAPLVASFTDVPTTDPFFREVEALAASGITQGCTATQFCPGSTLTRLQMAIFLARALGL